MTISNKLIRLGIKKVAQNVDRIMNVLVMGTERFPAVGKSIYYSYLSIGDGGILYLYTRKKFDWNEHQYTKFQTMVIGM